MDARTRLARLANALHEGFADYPGLAVCEPARLPAESAARLHVYLTRPGGAMLPRAELILEMGEGRAYREEVFRAAGGSSTREYWDPVRFDLSEGYHLAVPEPSATALGTVARELRDFETPEAAARAFVSFLERGLEEAQARDERD